MPWFLPALAAGATVALAKKIVARYWHGQHAHTAVADPPGLRTIARFRSARGEDVLLAIAAELARDLATPLEVTRDAVRTRPEPGADLVDVVRLARRGGMFTVELTRAWTGVYLGSQTRQLLARIADALDTIDATEVAWFARQDRELAAAHPAPFDDLALATPAR